MYRILVQRNPHPFDVPLFHRDGFLFNEIAHLQQQNDGPFYLVSALNLSTQRAEARCAFFIQANNALSPAAAPFGSVEFTKTLPKFVLDMFLSTLINVARSVDVAIVRLVNYPNCYAPEQACLLTNRLIEHGFYLREINPTSFLAIADIPFDRTIVPAERRRLRKCLEAGFQFMHWKEPNLHEVLDFLQETHAQKDYSLTLPPDRLLKLVQGFPKQFAVFVVKDRTDLTALTVAVRVRQDILYNFLPASHLHYQAFSPMVMLIDGLFTYCQQQQIRLLDLGVSLDEKRQQKPSLLRFKRNLGAQESPKLIFEKQL
ncbi:GNAT family N-acetyltransferase [Spirosoma foliorum]|uniref:GNAT family N-acetyltransferase n=1 Tax=Spirosoma foliorum TaxID=2710596 RepID=A0A7G5GPA0_9BACT|nr:GNAT family N-acetyltransferase [Spirosoma foliorum]QMW00692.1 GNAT family N-acetyltransferase [Spirosoma foliorum]